MLNSHCHWDDSGDGSISRALSMGHSAKYNCPVAMQQAQPH